MWGFPSGNAKPVASNASGARRGLSACRCEETKKSPQIRTSFLLGCIRQPLLAFIFFVPQHWCSAEDNGVDDTLWWFKAGTAFSGNLGIAYDGTLEFSLGAFSGTFSEGTGKAIPLVDGLSDNGHVYRFPLRGWTSFVLLP